MHGTKGTLTAFTHAYAGLSGGSSHGVRGGGHSGSISPLGSRPGRNGLSECSNNAEGARGRDVLTVWFSRGAPQRPRAELHGGSVLRHLWAPRNNKKTHHTASFTERWVSGAV